MELVRLGKCMKTVCRYPGSLLNAYQDSDLVCLTGKPPKTPIIKFDGIREYLSRCAFPSFLPGSLLEISLLIYYGRGTSSGLPERRSADRSRHR